MLLAAFSSALLCAAEPASTASSPASRPAPRLLDRQTRQSIFAFERALDNGNLLAAISAREALDAQMPQGYDLLTRRLIKLDEQFYDLLQRQQVETGNGYIWVRKASTAGPDWDKAKEGADYILKQQLRSKATAGVAVLRIRVQNAQIEKRVTVYSSELSTWECCWAAVNYQSVPDGAFVIVGGAYQRGPQHGRVSIEALAHANPTLALDIPEKQIIYQELFLRSVPEEQLGSVRVRVIPEPGLSLDGAVVRLGRRFGHWEGEYPLEADGTCTIHSLGAGPCDLYVDRRDVLCSSHERPEIKAGQTVDVELRALARRRVKIEWKYRQPPGEGAWIAGSDTVLSGGSGALGHNGSVYRLNEWEPDGTSISGMNGQLLPADAEVFEHPRIRATPKQLRDAGRNEYALSVGSVFAVRYGHPARHDEGEAVVRIAAIEAVVPVRTQPAAATQGDRSRRLTDK